MNRRQLLVRSGVALGAAALASARRAHAASIAGDERLDDWDAVRALFDVDPSVAHLAGFFLVSHPRPVREAIERYRRELDHNPIQCWHERHVERDAAIAAAAAAYLEVDAADVALTDSTTMGLGLVYTGMRLGEGDEILTSHHDHYSTRTALDFGVLQSGAKIVRVPLYEQSREASVDGIVASVLSRLSARTRVVAMTWVHSKTGLRLPVRAIADALAARAAEQGFARPLLCVDGVHGLGAVPGTPAELGCDVLIAGTHKWIFAPRGTGIVWARPEVWAEIAPAIPPFGRHDVPGTYHSPGGFHSFEHRWAVDEAFRLHEKIGRERVYERVRALNAPILAELAAMPHVALHTPEDPRLTSGIVCFEVDGLEPDEAVERLQARKIAASTSPYVPTYVRLSAGLLNDEAEVERAIEAVRALA
jgi:selenocysteine lyase/cysteine desulfurase